MQDFYGVTVVRGDALFEKIYSFFGFCGCKGSEETVEH